MKTNSKNRLKPEQLRWECDPKSLGVRSSADVKESRGIIGQDRAIRALRLGLEINQSGYNVFATGRSGTGRMTAINQLLAEFEQRKVELHDRCYLYNFKNVDQPQLVTLPAGQGRKLVKGLQTLLRDLRKDISSAFESRRFQEQKKRLFEHFQDRQRSVLRDFENKVKAKGFELVQVQGPSVSRPDIAPLVENQAVDINTLESYIAKGTFTKEQVDKKLADHAALESSMESVMREMRNIDRKAKESIEALNKKLVAPIVESTIAECTKEFSNEKLKRFFNDLKEMVVGDLARFRLTEEERNESNAQESEEDDFLEFEANLLVDNSETKGVPVIIETNPKFRHLFGTIERVIDRNGTWRTDFTLIKAGSLLRADGGYLVLSAQDTIPEPGVWSTLKRTLRNSQLEIATPETTAMGFNSALKPESINIDVKVIMTGDPESYYLLYEQDEDFKRIFKVRADFDVEMKNNTQAVQRYMSFAKTLIDDERMLQFDASALAAVIEYGARLADRKTKLSTEFTALADVVRESNYWAGKQSAKRVNGGHVHQAIEERIERIRLVEEKIHELIMDGTIFIDSKGMQVGQVNGLSVYDMGEYSFGRPTRITARTSLGRQGIINIEREASMSGPTHNKGVLILSGYLRSMYAQNKPLVLSASIAFEQSYNGVDGDSASSTEIYAILSSIANVPLRQDLAVTGSINQKGEIQPIGGANEKIEGFFDVCRDRGLTGSQGVMIPSANIENLMLRRDVVEAVRKKIFHIFAIRHIDEGIEILTGRSAKEIHKLVDARLTGFSQRWKEISGDGRDV
jgi:ATP-dependent Lon protease